MSEEAESLLEVPDAQNCRPSDKASKRRKVHREAEQRRKHKITQCIHQLSQLLPSCHYHSRETSAEVLERVINRLKELERENTLLTQVSQKSEGSVEQLQEQVTWLAAQHITMVTVILEHLQKKQSINGHPTSSLPDESEHVAPPLTSERLTFGIAELLPGTVPHAHSNPQDTPPTSQHLNKRTLSKPTHLPSFSPDTASSLPISSDPPPVWRPYSTHHNTTPPSSNFSVGYFL